MLVPDRLDWLPDEYSLLNVLWYLFLFRFASFCLVLRSLNVLFRFASFCFVLRLLNVLWDLFFLRFASFWFVLLRSATFDINQYTSDYLPMPSAAHHYLLVRGARGGGSRVVW